jgi:hypothetical protein
LLLFDGGEEDDTPKAKAKVDEEVVYEKLVVLISMFGEEKAKEMMCLSAK